MPRQNTTILIITALLLSLVSSAAVVSHTPHGCKYPHRDSSERFFYFLDLVSPDYHFSVSTIWPHYYHDLQRAVNATDLYLLPQTNNTAKFQPCIWSTLADVWVNGVHHGRLSYKRVQAPKSMPLTDITSLHSKQTTIYEPDILQSTKHKVVPILESNAPVIDLTILVAELLSPFIGLAVLFIPIYYLAQNISKRREATKGIVVELTTLPRQMTPNVFVTVPSSAQMFDKPPNYTDLSEYFEGDAQSIDMSALTRGKVGGRDSVISFE